MACHLLFLKVEYKQGLHPFNFGWVVTLLFHADKDRPGVVAELVNIHCSCGDSR